MPVLLLLGAEAALRVAGYGYATGFFIHAPGSPPGVFRENQKFGWSFFPPRLARAPDPIRLSKVKPPGTCRIFVFGGSAALGDPEPAYSFSRVLGDLLEARCPGVKFAVVNAAMTAISSAVVRRIARDCVPFQGDIWIVYMGNNEVVGPFGAASVFGPKAPPLLFIRAGLAIKRTRLGQLLDSLARRATDNASSFSRWEGMKMMLKDRVRARAPVLRRVYAHFRSNLEAILQTAAQAGVKPIVCTVSSNLKDCPPFASLHRPGLSIQGQAQWRSLVSLGAKFESHGAYSKALAQYRRAADIDDTYAELPFRMGRCYAALGDAPAARNQYARARDLDALRFRADTSINRIIRAVCSERASRGVRFFDSEAVLTKACRLGIPGAECFWDHVHLNFTGNYLVARGLAEQVLALLPERVQRQGADRMLTESECAQRLAYTGFDQESILQEMLGRVRQAPFTGQLDHKGLIARWSARLKRLEARSASGGLAQDARTYRTALTRSAGDWRLHYRFGRLLETAGELAGAERQWKQVLDIIPDYTAAIFKLGDLSERESKPAEARAYFLRVLALRPDSFEAMNGLGLVLMDQAKLAEAERFFRRALELAPDFAEARVNWGLALARRGLTAQAEVQYREALRRDPASLGARVNLGNLLLAQQRDAEAVGQYRAALALRPDQATLHLALANALAAAGRGREAEHQFREAARLDPALEEAYFNLGVLLAKRRDLPGATAAFGQAAKVTPNDPQAHLDLGVALAQQNQFERAILQFEAVLRLDPANAAAARFLEVARARLRLGP